MIEEARENLLVVIPHLRHAMALAKEEGKPMLGILAVEPNGGGRIVVKFEAEEFVNDLCRLLGVAVENTKEETSEAAATRLVQRVHAAGGTIVSTPLEGSDE
jgi:hypothetical protein